MTRFALMATTAALLTFGGANLAFADDCTGHDHSGATAAGAVGGGLIAGLATHNVAAGLGGAVVGGLIGNSIARNDDCERTEARDRAYAEDRDGPPPRYNDNAPPPPRYDDNAPPPPRYDNSAPPPDGYYAPRRDAYPNN
jgi:surface antigen